MGRLWGPVVHGRGGGVAGGGRCSIGASGGSGWEGRGRGGGVGDATSPGSACMAVLAWCGRVRAVLAGWAAGLGCCGTVVVVGAGGVPRGSGLGLVRCGWTRALFEVSRPAGGRAGGHPHLSWSSWPGGCRGRVSPPVPVGARGAGVPAVCLSEACLEASDVGALVREAHPRGVGLVGGGQVGVPKRHPALRGPQLRGVGLVCRVEEHAE